MFLFRMILAALRSLRANFVRSILAILGIVIGVGTVIAAVGVVEGATHDLLSDMQKTGANVMWLSPGSAKVQGRTTQNVKPLLLEDLDEIAYQPMVAAAAPEIRRISQVKFGNKNEIATIVGTNGDFFDVFSYHVREGHLLQRHHIQGRRAVAVIGAETAKKLFETRNPVGESIRIGNVSFEVIGVVQEKGVVGFANFDEQVYIPVSKAQSMYEPRGRVDQICVRAIDAESQAETRASVAKVLRRKHRLQLGEDDDFNIVTQKELFEQLSKATAIWQGVFLAISGISLLVGGFGIMNIMLVSVTERTREIGVRMAVGAKRGDVLIQFLAESSMICVVGAPLGIGLGWMLNEVVEAQLAPLKPILAPSIIAFAVAVAIATGIVSGLYPAWRASRLDPVDALRYE